MADMNSRNGLPVKRIRVRTLQMIRHQPLARLNGRLISSTPSTKDEKIEIFMMRNASSASVRVSHA